MDYSTLIIKSISREAEDFKTFVFENGHGINYKEGQYLTFSYTSQTEEVRRSYSIVSSPTLNEPLAIGVKRIPNGIFSRNLVDHANPGDKVLCTGAGGFFVLPDDIERYKEIYFFAAGSGITPVLSLLKTVLHQHPHIKAVLVYSNPSFEKIIYLSQLQELQKKFPATFHAEYLLSNSPLLEKARLNREMLVDLVKKYSVADYSQSLFYICGPQSYMRMCTYALQEENVPKENIKRENFVIEKIQPPKQAPPETEPHNVIINYEGKKYQLQVQYPDTILQAAKKHDINLPYSCETGRCGSCAAKCVKGEVWLSYNEVLTEKDLDKGLTLTCVGYPVFGDVELEIK